MSAATTDAIVPFVLEALEREGAAVERVGDQAVFAVLPGAMRADLDLPPAATLDLSSAPSPDHTPFPFEGAGMQWLIERVRGRGRRAAARLPAPARHATGRLEKARQRLHLLNATEADATVTTATVPRILLEFAYEARSEERTDGRVRVADPGLGAAPSTALADALTDVLGSATPVALALGEDAIAASARRAEGVVHAEVTARLDAFRTTCRSRLEAERERILAYYDRLVKEAGRRRRGMGYGEAIRAKREAVLRQRAERLDDLAERHAVAATFWLASAIVIDYEIVRCRFRVRRRQRELDLDVQWDPVLGDFLGPACAACGTGTLAVSICDTHGHVTCATCSARCPTCTRSVCRVCRPDACGCSPTPST
ncbi:MAG: hypothetical protein AB7I45_01505 [Planctomycetota bacterium]